MNKKLTGTDHAAITRRPRRRFGQLRAARGVVTTHLAAAVTTPSTGAELGELGGAAGLRQYQTPGGPQNGLCGPLRGFPTRVRGEPLLFLLEGLKRLLEAPAAFSFP